MMVRGKVPPYVMFSESLPVTPGMAGFLKL
jgi:hypothetical protein